MPPALIHPWSVAHHYVSHSTSRYYLTFHYSKDLHSISVWYSRFRTYTRRYCSPACRNILISIVLENFAFPSVYFRAFLSRIEVSLSCGPIAFQFCVVSLRGPHRHHVCLGFGQGLDMPSQRRSSTNPSRYHHGGAQETRFLIVRESRL